MSWEGAWAGAVVEVHEKCNIDWACLFENLSSPAIWVPALYGVISTVAALTPTEKDDKVLERIKNLGRQAKSAAAHVAEALPSKNPKYLGKPKEPHHEK